MLMCRRAERSDAHLPHLLAVHSRHHQRCPGPVGVRTVARLLSVHARRQPDGHGGDAHHSVGAHRSHEHAHRQEPHRLQPHLQEASILVLHSHHQHPGLLSYLTYHNISDYYQLLEKVPTLPWGFQKKGFFFFKGPDFAMRP